MVDDGDYFLVGLAPLGWKNFTAWLCVQELSRMQRCSSSLQPSAGICLVESVLLALFVFHSNTF